MLGCNACQNTFWRGGWLVFPSKKRYGRLCPWRSTDWAGRWRTDKPSQNADCRRYARTHAYKSGCLGYNYPLHPASRRRSIGRWKCPATHPYQICCPFSSQRWCLQRYQHDQPGQTRPALGNTASPQESEAVPRWIWKTVAKTAPKPNAYNR